MLAAALLTAACAVKGGLALICRPVRGLLMSLTAACVWAGENSWVDGRGPKRGS